MPLDQLLKRHFWAVIAVLVVVAAFLDAQGVMHLVGARLGPDDTQLAVPPLSARAPIAQPSAAPHATSATPILDRNPFDSVTGPLNLPPPVASQEVVDTAAPPVAVLDLSNPYGAPPCDGLGVLIITASADPDWSFAAMTSATERGKSFLRRRGNEIGGKTVEFVGWDRVWLTSGSTLCQVQMFKPPPPPTASAAPSAAPPPAASPNAVSEDIKNGIKKVGPNEFNVDRTVVDKILENQAELMRSARIVPEQENGKVVGIRMFGIKPDTLLGTLGLQNGDRLEKINGFEMASPETALEAYARLRTADHLTVSINRNGQPANIDFNIK